MFSVNSYDIDGVILMGELNGLRPGPEDIIVTGRSFQQRSETLAILRARNINNFVFFNPLSRMDPNYGRVASGKHKAKTITNLLGMGIAVEVHFEDDEIQAEIIRRVLPQKSKVVMIGAGEYAV